MTQESTAPPLRSRFFNQHWTWWLTLLTLVIVAGVRLRLLNYPLERDEGEYAYAGQLILQGIPPYELAYNMKFPGTYAAYAVIMKLFGETPAGIHFGLMCITTLTALMLYWLGRKMLDATAGMVAATTYAVLAANPTMLALSGHATHFAAVFAVAGLCLMWQARQVTHWRMPFLAGIMFGFAVLMKQHAALIGLWASAVFALACLKKSEVSLNNRLGRFAIFCLGMVLPFGLCCLILWFAGVFDKFWFWTVSYGSQYATLIPLSDVPQNFWYIFPWIVSRGLFFWLLAAFGPVLIRRDERLQGVRFWLLGFCLAATLTIVPGFYFREHYFILVLPALGLLAACAVSGTCHLWRQKWGASKFGQWPVGIFLVILALFFVRNSDVWFEMTPHEAARNIYGPSPFPEAEVAAQYIRANTPPDARIAVLGSEPEIYFLSQRHSATGYIYTYALMELQPFASKMQDEMIREIEAVSPRVIVFANISSSWMRKPGSDLRILNWWNVYQTNYTMVGVADVISPTQTRYFWNQDAIDYGKPKISGLEIYQRKTPALVSTNR